MSTSDTGGIVPPHITDRIPGHEGDQPPIFDDDYRRVEFSMAAVHRSDLDAVRRALEDVRDRYSRGGASMGYDRVRPGTKLNRR